MRLSCLMYGALLIFSLRVMAEDAPTVIMNTYDSGATPIFIANSAMYSSSGALSAVVPPDWRQQQQQLATIMSRGGVGHFSSQSTPTHHTNSSALAEPCGGAMITESSHESLVSRDSRYTSIANAVAIIAGTVRSITPGFFYGYPGSLVELGELDKIKLEAPYARVRDTLYIRLPYAHFISGGVEYCRETGANAYIPALGDKLLIFAYDPPSDVSGTFTYTTSSDVIAQSQSTSGIRIPPMLSYFAAPDATIDSIVAGIRNDFRHTTFPHPEHRRGAQ